VDLVIEPSIGVGGLALGMALPHAQDVAKSMPAYLEAESSPYFSHHASGLSIALEPSPDGLVKAIEVSRPDPDTDVRVLLHGISVFEDDADEVVSALADFYAIDLREGGRTAVVPSLLVAFWRATLPEFAGDQDGRLFDSVLLARPGYYKGPPA